MVDPLTSATREVSTHAPRAGGDKKRKGLKEEWRVSAHAPAQGAPMLMEQSRPIAEVSTHAPAQGAT